MGRVENKRPLSNMIFEFTMGRVQAVKLNFSKQIGSKLFYLDSIHVLLQDVYETICKPNAFVPFPTCKFTEYGVLWTKM